MAQEPATLSGRMNELAARGFTEQFKPVDGKLRGVGTGQSFVAEQVIIAEYYRFEGVSDPDDMAILYAIEAGDLRGTLVDAYGVYSDPAISAFLDDVALRPPRPIIVASPAF